MTFTPPPRGTEPDRILQILFNPVTDAGAVRRDLPRRVHYQRDSGGLSGITLCGESWVVRRNGLWEKVPRKGASSCMTCFRAWLDGVHVPPSALARAASDP